MPLPALRALVCMHAKLVCKHNITELPLKLELPATAMDVVCKYASILYTRLQTKLMVIALYAGQILVSPATFKVRSRSMHEVWCMHSITAM